MPFRALLRAAPLVVLVACGPQHLLPTPDAASLAAAQREIAAAPPLREHPRSPAEQRALLRRVAERVLPAARPVCAAAGARGCAFRIGLVEAEQVNAFATGEDIVAVTTGMLRAVDSEDELAAVLAHELAHHIADHINRSRTRTTLGALAGAVLGSAAGLGDLSGLGASAARLSYSKAEEREADYLAAFIVHRAGYSLDRAGEIWAKLTRAGDTRRTAGLLDTHPAGPERLAAWEETVEEIRASPGDPLPRAAARR